jgi:hypothetical protein
MFFWLLAGIAIGYFFKPQIDKLLGKVVKKLRDNQDEDRGY